MTNPLPTVRVTEIGEYIRHHSCERRFKLDHDGRRLTKTLPFFFTLSGAMDPVLAEAGRRREREWEGCLQAAGLADLCRYAERPGDEATAWGLFAGRCAGLTPGRAAYGREIEVTGEIGAFRLSGRIDFVLVRWDGDRPLLRLVECKASRKDRTYHRVQLVLYRMLVGRLLEACPLVIGGEAVAPGDIECVVGRIDEGRNTTQDILALPPLDLEMEDADVRLLLQQGGPLTGILDRDIAQLPYQLDSKCDDCALNVYCLPEAARGRRIELLGVDAGTVRALASAGVSGLDALADLPLDGPAATQVRAHPDFGAGLDTLAEKARARRSSLPARQGAPPADGQISDVIPLPHAGNGQLPPHITGASRLVRVYLSVSYDYVENRVGAVAAHVTRSDKPLSTLFAQGEEGRWRPDPAVKEQWATGKDETGRNVFADRPLEGVEIAGVLPKPWSGDYDEDTRRETDLLTGAFQKIVQAAQSLCPEGRAPLHFYVWDRGEITRLVEACARAETDLLGSLRELLGCRDSLEQLIFSCLGDEVDARYALAWTGRGLSAATSLRWFGRRFHWTRRVGDEEVSLDKVFAEGIFDFKTTLKFDDAGQWKPLDDAQARRHAFEVRACFADALPAPYWRAQWGTLPDTSAPGTPSQLQAAVRAYASAGRPGYLKAYLKARVQALRWIEEGIKFKNTELAKPLLDLAALPTFTLGVGGAAQAALDFLWLEQHVAVNDWTAAHLVPPAGRVPGGRTIPLQGVRALAANKLSARIDLTGYPLEPSALASRCSLAAGAFVRLSPCSDDPLRGQTVAQLVRGGSTCIIDRLDWERGEVELSVMPFQDRAHRYVLPSRSWPENGAGFERATLDEGLSDFVAGKVDERLASGLGAHVYDWFDPQRADIPPQQPIPTPTRERYHALLSGLDLGHGPLAPDQISAALDGLDARVQLLQGPPGTGKTQTTAAALLLRILARREAGDVFRPGDIVLVAANTHTAVDTLLRRADALLPRFRAGADAAVLPLPPVRLAKVGSSSSAPVGGNVLDFDLRDSGAVVAGERTNAVLVIGGTPNALLKMAKELGRRPPFNADPNLFQASALVVDEASMMVLPYFLAVASLVRPDGETLLAGDHRQLAPIMAHDWEHEERPPVALYRPHVSAYEAVRTLKSRCDLPDAAIRQSALEFTFRLPLVIRNLIARLYRLDGIELTGRADERPGRESERPLDAKEERLSDLPSARPVAPSAGSFIGPAAPAAADLWERLWQTSTGLFLLVHDERESRQSNPLEADILARVLQAAGTLPDGSVGVVVPHRAQRTLLQSRLAGNPAVDVIDTVERLQGGERETILVSATASDPAVIAARAEFLLGLNRANVAFSRAQKRLVVVCSDRLLAHIPPDVEHYAQSLLWKSLRAACPVPLGQTEVSGHTVRLYTAPPATC